MFNKKRYVGGMRNIALNSAFASSIDADSAGTRTRGGTRNLGTILNFTKTSGINDKVDRSNFREWTGIPETTRNNKRLTGNKFTGKIVADHRNKMNGYLDPIDHKKYTTVENRENSKLSNFSQTPNLESKNIPMSARNKIRLAELRTVERLNLNP